jgi:hypothetical protein
MQKPATDDAIVIRPTEKKAAWRRPSILRSGNSRPGSISGAAVVW